MGINERRLYANHLENTGRAPLSAALRLREQSAKLRRRAEIKREESNQDLAQACEWEQLAEELEGRR